MSEPKQMERLNYFTGFFMTDGDFKAEQTYHMEKLRLHNRGLHTPGIIPGIGQELRVEGIQDSDGHFSLAVRVCPGAALDGDGQEIFLGEEQELQISPASNSSMIYIGIQYGEQPANHVENVADSQYSGDTRWVENPLLTVKFDKPDNKYCIELARVNLEKNATAIVNPQDPAAPGLDEIDRRSVIWAGTINIQGSPPEVDAGVIAVMQNTRRSFADLARSYPVSSINDVRSAAITVEMLTRSGNLRLAQVGSILSVIAVVEEDVEQELMLAHPELINATQFKDFQAKVKTLKDRLQNGDVPDNLLIAQGDIAAAVHTLAEFAPIPVASAELTSQNFTATSDPPMVALDASHSKPYGNHRIVSYTWRRV